MVTSLLTDPESFFRQRSVNPGLLRPLVVVFVAAIVSAGGSLILFRALLGEAPNVIVALIGGGAFIAFLVPFIVWIGLTIVFYLISIAVGGDGSFGDTLKLAGWGFVPQIISGIISTVATYVALQSIEIPRFSQNIDPQNTAQVAEVGERFTEFSMALSSHPAARIAAVIGFLLLIWQLVIWIFAVKHARDLTTRGAVIAVGIPVGLYILFRLYGLLTGWLI